jgi:flagellar hook-length control protein FliK
MTEPQTEPLTPEAWEIRERVLERVAQETRWLVRAGRSEAEIHLEPPDLGKLSLRLVVADSSVQGFVKVENPFVKAILESDLPRLSSALAEGGLDLADFDISLQDEKRPGEGREYHRPEERPTRSFEEKIQTPAEPAKAPAVAGGGLVDYLM